MNTRVVSRVVSRWMPAVVVVCAGAIAVPAGVSVSAAVRGTPAEAKAMLQKAVEHYKAAGRKQALADFTAKKAPFSDRDLYVVCLDARHIVTAHGLSATYVGTSADLLIDADGKAVGKTAWDATASTGDGSVGYRFVNPVSKKTEPKVTFFQRIGEDVCGVGAYQPQ